ncbi:peptidoglycan-associated lipoprotein Pal [Catenovulum sp. 2E275]|uniref:peptidoglycan-associated lipoprotein Pal n=1 Tax=Catenovulum sp. 2E275 TaxID=2980497 RepID=UPI0021CEC3CB|nr:peptidoglycan-associated lipoprotein Pal [Catenovulum sp. 2E275]MCU4675409.1 peptidoglycan-associated lipoprotein Pal [Catenovulum sp. 2E275]
MQANQLLKYLVVVLPMLTAACSTTTGDEDTAGMTNSDSAQTGSMNNEDSVEVMTLEKKRQMEIEAQERKQAALRETNMIFFDFDGSQIQAKYFEVLEAHAAYLRSNPSAKVLIEGHADERGTPEYNIALGERRAKSVAKYLQNLGVMSAQISTVSYGEEKALDRSRTESAFAKNRRAVLVY